MAKAGPRRIEKYGDRFKAAAVKLSKLPGVSVQDVAARKISNIAEQRRILPAAT